MKKIKNGTKPKCQKFYRKEKKKKRKKKRTKSKKKKKTKDIPKHFLKSERFKVPRWFRSRSSKIKR